jgi:hypothetical protein
MTANMRKSVQFIEVSPSGRRKHLAQRAAGFNRERREQARAEP